MPSVDELRNLKPWELTRAVAAFLAIIAPGILILYLYKPGLVTELESAKLLMFSAALTLPLVALNALLFLFIGIFTGGLRDANRGEVWFWQAVWAISVLYGAILVAYLCAFTFRSFVGVLLAFDAIGALIVYFTRRFFRATTS